jgi:hypothetical protein
VAVASLGTLLTVALWQSVQQARFAQDIDSPAEIDPLFVFEHAIGSRKSLGFSSMPEAITSNLSSLPWIALERVRAGSSIEESCECQTEPTRMPKTAAAASAQALIVVTTV